MFPHIALRSEFSFKQTYGKVEHLIDNFTINKIIGFADFNNTFAHAIAEKYCKKKEIKPIFGVRLEVLKSGGIRTKDRKTCGPVYIFLAKNQDGLKEINDLTKLAWDNFYYKPMIYLDDVNELSNNVFVISANIEDEDARLDFVALTPNTPKIICELDKPKIFIDNNYFPYATDRGIYQLLAGSQKRGEDYTYKFETKREFQHILTNEEFYRIYTHTNIVIGEVIINTNNVAAQCNVELPKAKMVIYKGKQTIEEICDKSAKIKNINLIEGEYAERYKTEMELIKKKEYVDYFMIVAQMIRKAKQRMLVGPARGSSAGSLVCFLMGITEVDPIIHGLIFERFIDINRHDLPDIDIDFPDDGRESVIEDMFETHGSKNVCHISNINSYAAKSAIDDVGLALRIPKYAVDALKESIVDRTGGDARAAVSIKDTLETTEVGRKFVEKYPAIKIAERLQNHATHMGKHAAGIIVCNDEITKYGGVNSREGSIMMDKKAAEYLNLLKIDALGLRTLSVLQECASLIGMNFLDYYTLPLEDKKTFDIFNKMRLDGIFQFEGQAMRLLTERTGVNNFNDIVALTALARPGPLHSGGADKYCKRKMGIEETEYFSNHESYIKATEETFGVIVYQEQLMKICKDVGVMEWADVSAVRQAASKTLGKEFFNKYKEKFMAGAVGINKIPEKEATEIWENMITFGSWGMNKSHTVSYGLISYWCAYMKAHHPLEFVAANLRHSKGTEAAIKILRDAYEIEGIEYVPVDPDHSDIDWSVKDGKLIGGLINIDGIAKSKAAEIIKCRAGKKAWTPALFNKLMDPKTCFDTIYPCRDLWGKIYQNPREYGLSFPPTFIRDIGKEGSYVFIGKVTRRDLRDLNEYNEVMKRGGKYLKDHTFSIKLTVEDDTGQINCSVNRFKFFDLGGHQLSEQLVPDKTWVIIKGDIVPGWRFIAVNNIFDLSKLED